MGKRTRRVLIAALILVLAVSGGFIAWKSMDYYRGAQDYGEAAQVAGLELPAEVPQPSQPAAEDAPAGQVDPWAAALAQVDLEALREVNGDVVGWIAVPGTVLSYPVVQTGDNNYYLNRTWKKESSSVGAIFLEQTAAADMSGFNTLIYGHRMRNDTMFGSLREYRSADYWQEHPTVYLTTGGEILKYDIFAAYEVGIREIVYRLDIEETGQQDAFIRYGLDHSVIETGIVPAAEDRVLTLSTCTGSGHATRWVVQAVLRTGG